MMVQRRSGSRVVRTLAVAALLAVPVRAWADPACQGDCNGDGRVTVWEVITVVRMDLAEIPATTCPNGTRRPGEIDNVDVVCALRHALYGTCDSCPP